MIAADASTACVLDENRDRRSAISARRPAGSRSSDTGRHSHRLPLYQIAPSSTNDAKQLSDEERIALGVPVEKRKKLAAHLLPVERRLEPLLHLIAREPGECELAHDLVPGEHLAMRRAFRRRIRALRQTHHDPVGIELRQQMLERIPRRAVRPLHLVEHDDERALRAERANILRELAEQPILAARGVRRIRGRSERRLEMLQLLPFAPRRARKPLRRLQQRAPHAIRLRHVQFARRSHREQTASLPHLRLELAQQRRRPGSTFRRGRQRRAAVPRTPHRASR